jgi:hypothetical protein
MAKDILAPPITRRSGFDHRRGDRGQHDIGRLFFIEVVCNSPALAV